MNDENSAIRVDGLGTLDFAASDQVNDICQVSAEGPVSSDESQAASFGRETPPFQVHASGPSETLCAIRASF